MELWKNIEGYETSYQISSFGRIRRVYCHQNKNRRLLKPGCWNGYLCIHLWKQNRPTTYKIHTLVLNTFIGTCPHNMECRNLDGNPKNNHLDNLKWGTRSDNQKDSVKHGTNFRPNNIGSKNGHAKLTELQVRKIKILLMDKKSHTHTYCRTI